MLLNNDLIADGKAHASAFTDRLGGKEGIKESFSQRFWNTGAIIRNADADGLIFLFFCVLSSNRYQARCLLNLCRGASHILFFEGINGVGQDIHKRLIELTGKAVDFGKIAILSHNLNLRSLLIRFEAMLLNQNRTLNAFTEIERLFCLCISSRKGS